MKYALNATDIRLANRRLILDAVYQSGTTSRSQLARDLQLSKPAISDNLQTLLDIGIVGEGGEGSVGPAGGRKSILLRFKPLHRVIIAVNLNFSNPVFALTDMNGDILHSFEIIIPAGTAIEACRDLVLDSIRSLIRRAEEENYPLFCIAVAAPGTYDREGNLLGYSTSCGGPAWWRLNLRQEFSSAFPYPVIIYNDVKAAALGEWEKGAGSREKNLFYLSTGLGIGSGIILGGKLLMGEDYNSGEIYNYIDSSNAHCGIKLEDTVCMGYLEDQCLRIQGSPFLSRSQVSLEEIIRAYGQEDETVCSIVKGICRRLAVVTYNYITFISVSHVVFGGEFAPFCPEFSRQLEQLFPTTGWPPPHVYVSQLGKYAGIQGMVHLARERYFCEICSH